MDVSELRATALTCVPWAIMGIFVGGDRLRHSPNRLKARGSAGPLWEAKDGLINYGYGDWQQWENALTFLGNKELAENPEYIPSWGRHQKDPIPVIEALTHLAPRLEKNGQFFMVWQFSMHIWGRPECSRIDPKRAASNPRFSRRHRRKRRKI